MYNINYELEQWKECKLIINNKELGNIIFNLSKQNYLIIDQFETKDKYHIFRKPYPDIYIGTELFNYVLLSLQNSNIEFDYIYGKLSSADAQNGNWKLSIPFYANFCNHLNPNINYRLSFYISEDKDCKKQIASSNDIIDWYTKASKLIDKHLHQDLYFKYFLHKQ